MGEKNEKKSPLQNPVSSSSSITLSYSFVCYVSESTDSKDRFFSVFWNKKNAQNRHYRSQAPPMFDAL